MKARYIVQDEDGRLWLQDEISEADIGQADEGYLLIIDTSDSTHYTPGIGTNPWVPLTITDPREYEEEIEEEDGCEFESY